MSERDWSAGFKAAHLGVLQSLLSNLGQRERKAHGWRIERGRAVLKLRKLCEAFGDNDWEDDLDLSDVIEKHLWRHLEAIR